MPRATPIACLALAGGLLCTSSARADDGPVSALGNMMNASPTLTIVSTGVVLAANTSFTVISATSAFGQAEYPATVWIAQMAVALPQAGGYAAAPMFFDTSRWDPLENLLLLLPGQAWTTGLSLYGGLALADDPTTTPLDRAAISAIVGTNYAFSANALGGLIHDRGVPLELAIPELIYGVGSSSFAFSRVIAIGEDKSRESEQIGWAATAAWSLLLTAHGVVSVFSETERELHGGTEPNFAVIPSVSPVEGGAIVQASIPAL